MSNKPNKKDLLRETSPQRGYNGYTYADYLNWSDDQRYELIDGSVYIMSPAPSRTHQEILGKIYRKFSDYLDDKECKVYFAPFDLRLAEEGESDKTAEDIFTVVQPDLLVVCDLEKLDEQGCKGAPDLIVEIVSPSSGGKDRKIKRDLYENHGVKEYWIVDYYSKTIEVYLLNDNQYYEKPAVYIREDILPVSIFNALEINLEQIFKE